MVECLIFVEGRVVVCLQRKKSQGEGRIYNHSPRTRAHKPWDWDQQLVEGSGDRLGPIFVTVLESRIRNTVEPLLSGHPRGNGKWPLNRGWPVNRGSSGIGPTLP